MNNPYEYLKEYEGKEFKYKEELCPLLNIEYKIGKAKDLQLNQLRQYMDIEKVNRKIRINKIYDDEQVNKNIDYKKFQNIRNRDWLKQFDVSGYNLHNSGIYKIVLDNVIYIGQTNDFYNRFREHFYSEKETGKLLRKGAIFSIIELEDDLDKILKKEEKYIKEYSENKNYICINIDFNYINSKEKKTKYKNIKVLYEDYDKIIDFLESKGIYYE